MADVMIMKKWLIVDGSLLMISDSKRVKRKGWGCQTAACQRTAMLGLRWWKIVQQRYLLLAYCICEHSDTISQGLWV